MRIWALPRCSPAAVVLLFMLGAACQKRGEVASAPSVREADTERAAKAAPDDDARGAGTALVSKDPRLTAGTIPPPATSATTDPDKPHAKDVQGKTPVPVYSWTSGYQAQLGDQTGATRMQISETSRGASFKALADDANVPVIMSGGSTRFVPDAWRSGLIRVAIDPGFKKVRFVGLTFTRPVGIWILDKGAIALDAEGVTLSDQRGTRWVSKKFTIDGDLLNLLVRQRAN